MKKTLGRRNLERKEPQLRSGRWLSFYFSVRLFLLSFFFLFYFILSSGWFLKWFLVFLRWHAHLLSYPCAIAERRRVKPRTKNHPDAPWAWFIPLVFLTCPVLSVFKPKDMSERLINRSGGPALGPPDYFIKKDAHGLPGQPSVGK